MRRDMSGWDFLADLWSGRIHNTLLKLITDVKSLKTHATDTNKEMDNMTENEQRIVNAANRISEVADNLQAQINGFRSKVETLEQQAAQPTAADVEDLSQEFEMLEESVSKLSQLASGITADVNTGNTGTDGAENAPVDSAPVFGNTGGQPAGEVTPLAGESGPTDAPADPEPDTDADTSESVGSGEDAPVVSGTTPVEADQPHDTGSFESGEDGESEYADEEDGDEEDGEL